MALGADRGNVLALVLRGALALLAFGLLFGVPLTLAAGRLLASQLYGINRYDPVMISVAIVALTLSALIAALIPAFLGERDFADPGAYGRSDRIREAKRSAFSPRFPPRPSAGNRGPGSDKSASCGRCPSGSGSWRGYHARRPDPRRCCSRARPSRRSYAGLDAAARHPHREGARMMVAAQEFRVVASLVHRRAAEFAAPNDDGAVQQSALLQIGDKRRRRAICFLAKAWQADSRCHRGSMCRDCPIRDDKAGQNEHHARQDGGPADNYSQTISCPAACRTSRECRPALLKCPPVQERLIACDTPSHRRRCE